MIIYDAEKQIFKLDTKNTTYAFGFASDFALVHIYYGKKIRNINYWKELLNIHKRGFSATESGMEEFGSTDAIPMEFSTFGNADLRLSSIDLKFKDGTNISRFSYRSHKIYAGKPTLKGLPASYVEDSAEADTLELELFDEIKKVSVTLIYTAYNDIDVITRSMRVKNESLDNVYITRIMSATVDFEAAGTEYDFVHLEGAWARERAIERTSLMIGNQEIYSRRGSSSHHHNPFFALAQKNSTELVGDVYGFNLVYSGCFTAGVERDAYNTARCYLGINPSTFNWCLESDAEFQSPEVVMVFSSEGLSGMSREYHKLYRTRLCRGKFRDFKRYTLINNWEGTYFDFNEEKILDIAKKGAEIGLDLMVLDDGWFGKRNHDKASLGDWVVNPEKLPNGLNGLANKINEMGMKFGLWFEPEMVNPDSDLFRAHPDWAIHTKGYSSSFCRNQLVLDFSRKEVRDHIFDCICKVLDQGNVEYIKWDMNRSLGDIWSSERSAGAVTYDYILGVYDFMEKLITRYPNILLETCSSGGGRFDAGMLYYSPQIWCSDNTDALDRVKIQHGTSFFYPVPSMGAHVSVCPNHQTGRTISFRTRGVVAMSGTFGYELNPAILPQEIKADIKEQIIQYKEYRKLIRDGRYYRLTNPGESNLAAWEFVSPDQKNVLLNAVIQEVHGCRDLYCVRLRGLQPQSVYADVVTGKKYSGSTLMKVGYPIPEMKGNVPSCQVVFKLCE